MNIALDIFGLSARKLRLLANTPSAGGGRSAYTGARGQLIVCDTSPFLLAIIKAEKWRHSSVAVFLLRLQLKLCTWALE